MMTTRFSKGLRARPLEARADRDESVIWFLTDLRGAKDDEIEAFPEICLTFVYPKQKVYLSMSGQASVSRDTERARSLWNEKQQVWWPGGPSDPNVLVIQFNPERAEISGCPASRRTRRSRSSASSRRARCPSNGLRALGALEDLERVLGSERDRRGDHRRPRLPAGRGGRAGRPVPPPRRARAPRALDDGDPDPSRRVRPRASRCRCSSSARPCSRASTSRSSGRSTSSARRSC